MARDVTWEELTRSVPASKCRKLIDEFEQSAASGEAQLSSAYRNRGVTLVTGAGVSMDAGVPSWAALLAKLRAATLPSVLSKNGKETIGKIIGRVADGESPIVAARHISVSMKRSEFVEAVRSALYEEVYESDLVAEISRFCVKNESLAGVLGILTYNFDLILEEYLNNSGVITKRVFRGSSSSESGLAVNHVHGFLGRKKGEGTEIILSETQYHTEYAQPYSWSNVVQLNTFRETSCLFVGSSMSDPNQRRLLEIAKREHSRTHFAILRRTSPRSTEDALSLGWGSRGKGLGRPTKKQTEDVELRCKLLSRMLDHTRAQALQELGVTAIWIDEYSDIIGLLKKVRLQN